MSKRTTLVAHEVRARHGENTASPPPTLRSSPTPLHHLGRATSGASALALALAFLAPKPAAAVPFWEDLTSTKLPAPDPLCETTSQAGCYTSWLVATDLDNDGDMDVLLANGGGYYEPDFKDPKPDGTPPPASLEPSTVYLNDGTGNFIDVTNTSFNGALGRLRQVGVADLNGDGLKDVFMPNGYGFALANGYTNPGGLGSTPARPMDVDKLFIQTAPGVFEDKAATLLPPGMASNTPAFHFGDLDGDGDMDLVTTDWFTSAGNTPVFLSLYLNDGTGKLTLEEEEQDPPDWLKTDRLPPTIPFTSTSGKPYWGSRAIDLDFADIDNDFDLDILVNMRNGISRIFLNDGKGYFKDGTGNVRTVLDPATGTLRTFSNYPQKNGPYVYNQELCDIDNDGDLDMLLDNAGARPTGVTSGNFTQVLVNDGKGVFVDETRARIFGETGSDDNAVKCVDVNNDGNYDLLVASLAGQSEKLLLADGTGKFNMVPDAFPKINDSTLGIDATDFDGDGLMDVVTGQGENRAFFQERLYHGIAAQDGTGAQPDTKPPLFRAIEKPVAIEGKPIVMRLAVRDAATSETGDMVKDVSVVYSTPFGVSGKVKATFIGGDLFRAVIPAQEAYTTITLAPQATDRRGLKGFGTPVAVTVKEAPLPPVTGGGGEGGSGGEPPVVEPVGGAGGEPPVVEPGVGGEPPVMGSAGMPSQMEPDPETGGTGEEPTSGTSTGASSGSGGKPGEGGAPSSGGTTSSPPGGGDDDDGCSVASTRTGKSTSGWLAALGLALALGRRRRASRGA